MNERIDKAWIELRNRLASRARELDHEVRSYPTPIARCDEQLTQALEQRDAAFRQLRFALDLDGLRSGVTHEHWIARVREFVASLGAADGDAIKAARDRIIAEAELP